MFPFKLDEEYPRKALLDFLGSRQRQSGVLWGDLQPSCIICTSGGRHGLRAGYFDSLEPDGTWLYYGQGRNGDQLLENAANARLASRLHSVLLFTAREPRAREISEGGYGKIFKYRGTFNVLGYDHVVPTAGERRGDRLVRFSLIPASGMVGQPEIRSDVGVDIKDLKRRILTIRPGATGFRSGGEYRVRSQLVRIYALRRAGGFCEACGAGAPFLTSDGNPFLEVHHILRLSDDGDDEPQNVAALCPNCHRRAHHAGDRLEFNRSMVLRILELERD
jgi:5-methylcytosine-specific restriction protein A